MPGGPGAFFFDRAFEARAGRTVKIVQGALIFPFGIGLVLRFTKVINLAPVVWLFLILGVFAGALLQVIWGLWDLFHHPKVKAAERARSERVFDELLRTQFPKGPKS